MQLECSARVNREAMPLDPTAHQQHQAILPNPGDVSALPNTQKQTQGSCQNEETKKHSPSETTEQNSRKRTKQNKKSNLLNAEFKTLVIRMLKELRENLNSIKKIQSEAKDTVTEIKNNLQGTTLPCK